MNKQQIYIAFFFSFTSKFIVQFQFNYETLIQKKKVKKQLREKKKGRWQIVFFSLFE